MTIMWPRCESNCSATLMPHGHPKEFQRGSVSTCSS